MILLASPLEKRNECAAALQVATGEPIAVAENLLQAMTLLRQESYSAAVFDQNLAENEPGEIQMAFEHLGAAVALQVNLGTSGTDRLVRELRAAWRRRERGEIAARAAVARALHGKLTDTVTTLLLDCELARETVGMPPAAAERLAAVHEMAQKLRAELEANEAAGEGMI